MPDYTPNYGLAKPDVEAGELMSDVATFLNNNWTALEGVAAPDSGTTLPQSGSYKVGDRFYKTDTKSIYILVCRDANWGWYWRPVQDAISPWFTVPTSAMSIAGWTLNPTPANPMAIALDNKGRCHWRGVIGPSSGTFARLTSISVFPCPPIGIRPRLEGTYMIGHETLAVNTTATSLQSYQGARILIPANPALNVSVRGFGGTADFNRVHLTGVSYAAGSGLYYTP